MLLSHRALRLCSFEFYGHRSGTLRDPFGHEWTISQEIEKVTREEMQRRWNAMVAEPKKSAAAAGRSDLV